AGLNSQATGQDVVDAVNSTLPVLNGDLHRAVFEAMRGARGAVRTHMNAKRGLNSGDGMDVDGNAWVKAFGSWVDQDDDNGALGYSADSYGVVLGADADVTDRATIGAAFAYTTTDIDGDGVRSHDADIDSYEAILYGSYSLGNDITVGWQADIATHDNDIERNIPFMGLTARADYDSWSAHVGLDVEKAYAIGKDTTFTPSVRLDYSYIDEDGYIETGAGALNLTVEGIDSDELIVTLDGKISHEIAAKATLTANLGVGYDLLADEETVASTFAGLPGVPFNTTGIDPSSLVVEGGAGVEIGDRDGVRVTLRYDFEGREDLTNHSASLKVNVPF
ncbi:MAG: hypothetical protein B5M56_07565, partial [Desulfococcus sp. 4484_241]